MPPRCSACERDHVGHVDSEGLAQEPALAELVDDLAGHQVRDTRLVRHGAAHARHSGAPARLGEPRRVQLVVASGGAEVPEDGIGVAGEQDEARVLVTRPLADMRARDVADVVGIKEEEGAEVRLGQRLPDALEALPPQPRKVDPLLPVDRHAGTARGDGHD